MLVLIAPVLRVYCVVDVCGGCVNYFNITTEEAALVAVEICRISLYAHTTHDDMSLELMNR